MRQLKRSNRQTVRTIYGLMEKKSKPLIWQLGFIGMRQAYPAVREILEPYTLGMTWDMLHEIQGQLTDGIDRVFRLGLDRCNY